jgi:hypothetical protein
MDVERDAGAPPVIADTGSGPLKRACIPQEVTNGPLVRVVVGFMDQHPDRLHYRLSVLAIGALTQEWPCP